MTDAPVEFRARHGGLLTMATAAICVLAVALTLADDVSQGVQLLPAAVIPPLVVWIFYGRPAVVVSDGGVEIRNVLRTVTLPWPAIIRVDTKYALTLETAYGTYAAWAAPAPTRAQTTQSARTDAGHLHESTSIGGGVRPGDLTSSTSGQAAEYIRRRWHKLHEAGFLDDPRLEQTRPRERWNSTPLVGLLVIAAAVTLGWLL